MRDLLAWAILIGCLVSLERVLGLVKRLVSSRQGWYWHLLAARKASANEPLDSLSASRTHATPIIPAGLVESLASTYGQLLKRQRATSNVFVNWGRTGSRTHEFCWIPEGIESLLTKGEQLTIRPGDQHFDSIRQMMGTAELNPYEREILYGYPYVVGFQQLKAIRAPLFTIPIRIETNNSNLVVSPSDDEIRFNSLPFRSEEETDALNNALGRLIDSTPPFPACPGILRTFCEIASREIGLDVSTLVEGKLFSSPSEPDPDAPLSIVNNAALFVAPKTSYFLVKDLEHIGGGGAAQALNTALGWLLGKRGPSHPRRPMSSMRPVSFPFSSNPSQRRMAQLLDDPDNHILVMQGPPGTGKSLTIANIACHAVSAGKKVLISSQKDKALEVVDQVLRRANLPQLPMTLLHQDRDSKHKLREGVLASVQQIRPLEDTLQRLRIANDSHEALNGRITQSQQALSISLFLEHLVALRESQLRSETRSVHKWIARLRLAWALRRARRLSPLKSDHHGAMATKFRQESLASGRSLLSAMTEHRLAKATPDDRNALREFSRALARDQKAAKNFKMFDRLKDDRGRCEALLNSFNCWIMTPDDVARIFPCEPGLFDLVIIDEASQCDLPSMSPVLYRAKQAVIAGDSKQMQARRFSFTSSQVSSQAWREAGMHEADPDGLLDPLRTDLLQLASMRLDDEVFLDEHYRSRPRIIAFSNRTWYRDRLRIMRDEADGLKGGIPRPSISMYHVKDARVTKNKQENEGEARALVAKLKEVLESSAYANSTVGIICLFEEQMKLVAEIVMEEVAEDQRLAHKLVVVNPDGFQGDERDVVFYSLSYDAQVMGKAVLSARQAAHDHIQGMLNVAFTRARNEVHVFHTAEIADFGMASGEGVIKDWLEHCRDEKEVMHRHTMTNRQPKSEFEYAVANLLREAGLAVIHQHPSCGFYIDLVVERNGQRLAIECDGEAWHLDEHGQLKLEDIQRQEILERAGWRVLRIPYRGWRVQPTHYIELVLKSLT